MEISSEVYVEKSLKSKIEEEINPEVKQNTVNPMKLLFNLRNVKEIVILVLRNVKTMLEL
jgi:hypothetical protein